MTATQKRPVMPHEIVTMRHLDSTSLCFVGYLAIRQQMFVRFNSSLVIYGYNCVTVQMWQEFELALSRGSWVATRLIAQP